jgi:peptidoglycan/xylan/chitin deacetylase (PgdA/CDA1 family)
MKQLRNNVIRAGLGALYFSGAHHLLRPLLSGVGAIFMLHQVRPARDGAFQPNRHLEVTPDFLRATLRHLRSHDIDIVSMDELRERLVQRNFARRFAAFTFDDGYRDNLEHALPVLREFQAPSTVYVASDFAAGTGRLWWIALEAVIAGAEQIEVQTADAVLRLDAATPATKQAAFDRLHDWLRALPGEHDLSREIEALCARYGVDMAALCRGLCLPWDELKVFAADPLIGIGAHSISHCNLARLNEATAAEEMAESRVRIERALGRPVLHFAYPYGDREAAGEREFALAVAAGFKTAVTTRPGMLFAENAGHMTSLPRVSLNGNYQDTRILPVLTSGAATAMWNGFRRIAAA